MRDRWKGIENSCSNNNNFTDYNNYFASEMPCQKHPTSTPVGICPYCLKDRLVKLVCSECGEQRLSSCSCSDVSSSYRNSCSTTAAMEVGSVGRVSFLIENDNIQDSVHGRTKRGEEQVIFLRRSSSSCVEVKKSNGFWRIKRLFRKKTRYRDQDQEQDQLCNEIWVSDIMGVSRSRSLCSFRGTVGCSDQDDHDQGSEYRLSSAKISDVTSGIFVDQLSESESSRKSGAKRGGTGNVEQLDRTYSVPNRSVFPARESDFSAMDESAFIDLKLDLLSEPKRESSYLNLSSDQVMKRGRKSQRVWKWIFKYHPASKRKEILKSS